ncbi:hypothetical protein CHISP_0187 [Chitinispirillum alkaliphilum]|nr:hypothetical protein CHISP_0187 [Chitinispirillum alkaliphilum]
MDIALPRAGEYTLKVFSLNGAQLHKTAFYASSAGRLSVDWDSSDFGAGNYLFSIEGNGVNTSRQITLTK